jgi:hypothetical protein
MIFALDDRDRLGPVVDSLSRHTAPFPPNVFPVVGDRIGSRSAPRSAARNGVTHPWEELPPRPRATQRNHHPAATHHHRGRDLDPERSPRRRWAFPQRVVTTTRVRVKLPLGFRPRRYGAFTRCPVAPRRVGDRATPPDPPVHRQRMAVPTDDVGQEARVAPPVHRPVARDFFIPALTLAAHPVFVGRRFAIRA